MTTQRMIIFVIGIAAMFLIMLLRREQYREIDLCKIPLICIYLALCGVLGTFLMFYIENGYFSGTSFFGAILFVPILMLPALIFKIPYGTLMDFCAPTGCMMMSVIKFECILVGCCAGKFLPAFNTVFPSQQVEIIVSFAIMAVLLWQERNTDRKGQIYPLYLILYGSTRFVLNWFRADLNPFVLGLPPGNFWGIVSVICGALWLIVIKHHRKTQ